MIHEIKERKKSKKCRRIYIFWIKELKEYIFFKTEGPLQDLNSTSINKILERDEIYVTRILRRLLLIRLITEQNEYR